jgi:sugar phosphate isomerase/epimerase
MTQLGLQLYSIRKDLQSDFDGTLRRLHPIGYGGVEFAGYYGWDSQSLRSLLRECQLRAAGTHLVLDAIDSDYSGTISFCSDIECESIICPWIPPELRQSEEDYLRIAERLMRIGRQLALDGIHFMYHMHGYDLRRLGEHTGLDLILSETDPALVKLELDVFWVEASGNDSNVFYDLHHERCPSIHLKDMNNRIECRDVEVGTGVIDIARVVRAGMDRNAKWFIVEQEKFDIPEMESVSISARNVNAMMR